MGNRANFVIVEDGDWRLYYSHWAGCRMLDAFVAGPDYALKYVQSLRQCSKEDWIHPLWVDGAAVLDLDRRRLVFFGDEIMVDMPERRALMIALAAVWGDYEIGWAYDGIAEVAGYVGVELSSAPTETLPRPELTDDRNALCQLVSVVGADSRIRLWPLRWDFSQAWHGPALLDKLPGRGVSRLALGRIPEGGVHLDVSRKTLGAWHAVDSMGIFPALPSIWSGWQTECWEDRFEEQVMRCNGALQVPALDLTAAINSAQDWIRGRVFQSFSDSPVGRICALAELLDPVGPGLVVNEDAMADGATRPSKIEWQRFVVSASPEN